MAQRSTRQRAAQPTSCEEHVCFRDTGDRWSRVYAYFGNIGLFCYDLEGKALWSTNWPVVKTRYGWAPPLRPCWMGTGFVVNDNEEKSFMEALDTKTGRRLWRMDRDEKSNWATPYVWQNELRTELIVPGTKRIRSYDRERQIALGTGRHVEHCNSYALFEI